MWQVVSRYLISNRVSRVWTTYVLHVYVRVEDTFHVTGGWQVPGRLYWVYLPAQPHWIRTYYWWCRTVYVGLYRSRVCAPEWVTSGISVLLMSREVWENQTMPIEKRAETAAKSKHENITINMLSGGCVNTAHEVYHTEHKTVQSAWSVRGRWVVRIRCEKFIIYSVSSVVHCNRSSGQNTVLPYVRCSDSYKQVFVASLPPAQSSSSSYVI